MANQKKVVKYKSEKTESNEVYGKDSHGKIIKIEQTGDPKKRATCKRVRSIICWVLAIACEVIAILRLTDVINWFSNCLSLEAFLVIFILLDLVFVIIGSQLWKKANHIDPVSEKNKTKFWLWNNLWAILSVIAFLPIIILVFMNKDLDKKSKGLVGGIAIAALAIAGLTSFDWNPVSMEWLEQAEREVLQVSDGTVYWAPSSKKYHVDPDCPSFSRSETVYEGTVRDAYEQWLTDPCRRCIPEYHEEDVVDNTEIEAEEEWEDENLVWDLLEWLLE